MASRKSQVKFEVTLDENHVPEKIEWEATEAKEQGECHATLISIWDSKEKNTLKIDLWTKEMKVDDMKLLVHQTMLTLADTFERATGDEPVATAMREFSTFFGEETGIIAKKE